VDIFSGLSLAAITPDQIFELILAKQGNDIDLEGIKDSITNYLYLTLKATDPSRLNQLLQANFDLLNRARAEGLAIGSINLEIFNWLTWQITCVCSVFGNLTEDFIKICELNVSNILYSINLHIGYNPDFF